MGQLWTDWQARQGGIPENGNSPTWRGSDSCLSSYTQDCFSSSLPHSSLPPGTRKGQIPKNGEADSTPPEEKAPKSHCKGCIQEAAENSLCRFYWSGRTSSWSEYCYFSNYGRAKEMFQQLKFLLEKHQDLNLNPHYTHKSRLASVTSGSGQRQKSPRTH